MPFLEVRFPTNVSYGAVGGQNWSTRVVETDAGFEFRQQMWDRTRGHWHVGHNLRTPEEWAVLIAFHRLVRGKLYGFRFQDWTDYTDGGQGRVRLNSKGNLQLAKKYSLTTLVTPTTTLTDYRFITKPQPNTITFNASCVVDYATGEVSGPEAAQDVAWAGQFDVPARFDIDAPELSMDLPSGAGWRGIPIIEIRVSDP